MRLNRFFIPPPQIQGGRIFLSESVFNHAIKVLRKSVGDLITVFDGTGKEYQVRLLDSSPKQREAVIVSVFDGKPLPEPRVYLYQAMIKKERWEWLLEKGTELGVHAFIPMLTKYTELEEKNGFDKKLSRWNSIAQSACEQSGRSFLPEIFSPISFEKALQNYSGHPFFLHCGTSPLGESSEIKPLKSALQQIFSFPRKNVEVSLFIGPEGGFSQKEADEAFQTGLPLVSLGDQILRSETAGMASASILFFWFS